MNLTIKIQMAILLTSIFSFSSSSHDRVEAMYVINSMKVNEFCSNMAIDLYQSLRARSPSYNQIASKMNAACSEATYLLPSVVMTRGVIADARKVGYAIDHKKVNKYCKSITATFYDKRLESNLVWTDLPSYQVCLSRVGRQSVQI